MFKRIFLTKIVTGLTLVSFGLSPVYAQQAPNFSDQKIVIPQGIVVLPGTDISVKNAPINITSLELNNSQKMDFNEILKKLKTLEKSPSKGNFITSNAHTIFLLFILGTSDRAIDHIKDYLKSGDPKDYFLLLDEVKELAKTLPVSSELYSQIMGARLTDQLIHTSTKITGLELSLYSNTITANLLGFVGFFGWEFGRELFQKASERFSELTPHKVETYRLQSMIHLITDPDLTLRFLACVIEVLTDPEHNKLQKMWDGALYRWATVDMAATYSALALGGLGVKWLVALGFIPGGAIASVLAFVAVVTFVMIKDSDLVQDNVIVPLDDTVTSAKKERNSRYTLKNLKELSEFKNPRKNLPQLQENRETSIEQYLRLMFSQFKKIYPILSRTYSVEANEKFLIETLLEDKNPVRLNLAFKNVFSHAKYISDLQMEKLYVPGRQDKARAHLKTQIQKMPLLCILLKPSDVPEYEEDQKYWRNLPDIPPSHITAYGNHGVAHTADMYTKFDLDGKSPQPFSETSHSNKVGRTIVLLKEAPKPLYHWMNNPILSQKTKKALVLKAAKIARMENNPNEKEVIEKTLLEEKNEAKKEEIIQEILSFGQEVYELEKKVEQELREKPDHIVEAEYDAMIQIWLNEHPLLDIYIKPSSVQAEYEEDKKFYANLPDIFPSRQTAYGNNHFTQNMYTRLSLETLAPADQDKHLYEWLNRGALSEKTQKALILEAAKQFKKQYEERLEKAQILLDFSKISASHELDTENLDNLLETIQAVRKNKYEQKDRKEKLKDANQKAKEKCESNVHEAIQEFMNLRWEMELFLHGILNELKTIEKELIKNSKNPDHQEIITSLLREKDTVEKLLTAFEDLFNWTEQENLLIMEKLSLFRKWASQPFYEKDFLENHDKFLKIKETELLTKSIKVLSISIQQWAEEYVEIKKQEAKDQGKAFVEPSQEEILKYVQEELSKRTEKEKAKQKSKGD